MHLAKKIALNQDAIHAWAHFTVQMLDRLKFNTALVNGKDGKTRYDELISTMMAQPCCVDKLSRVGWLFEALAKNPDEIRSCFALSTPKKDSFEKWVTRLFRLEFPRLGDSWPLPAAVGQLDFAQLNTVDSRQKFVGLGTPVDTPPVSSTSSLGKSAMHYRSSASSLTSSLAGGVLSPSSTQSHRSTPESQSPSLDADFQRKTDFADCFNREIDNPTLFEDVIQPTLDSSPTTKALAENLFGLLDSKGNSLLDSYLLEPTSKANIDQNNFKKLEIILILLRLILDLPLNKEFKAKEKTGEVMAKLLSTSSTTSIDTYFSALVADNGGYRQKFSEFCWPNEMAGLKSPAPAATPTAPVRFRSMASAATHRPVASRSRAVASSLHTSRVTTITVPDLKYEEYMGVPIGALMESFGNYKLIAPGEPRHKGLRNWGNQCFGNSAFQLMANRAFLDRLLGLRPIDLLATGDEPPLETKVKNTQCLIYFLSYILSGNEAYLTPLFQSGSKPIDFEKSVKDYLLKQASSERLNFANGGQHCSFEFFIKLMEVCGGQIETKIGTRLFEPRAIVTQPLPGEYPGRTIPAGDFVISLGNGSGSIQSGLEKFCKEETITRGNYVRASDDFETDVVYTKRKMTVTKTSNLLVFSLKDFTSVSGQREHTNIERRITVPVETMVDGKPHVEVQQFQLVSYVAHSGGSASSGHYVAATYTSDGWNVINDSSSLEATKAQVSFVGNVLQCSDGYLKHFKPYLLMYERVS